MQTIELLDTLSAEPTSNKSEVAIIGCGCSSATETVANLSKIPVVSATQDVSSSVTLVKPFHTNYNYNISQMAVEVTIDPWLFGMASVHTADAKTSAWDGRSSIPFGG